MAKAAYRSGEALFDQRTGEFHDYRGGELRVIDKWIMTQRGVAEPGREALWNAAEAAERRINGRVATEFEIGLPHELTDAQRKDLLKNFLAPIIARYGVAADVAIHTADDWRNVHAHILLTHREYGPDGFGEIANRRTVTKKVKGQDKQIEVAGIAATPADIKFLREQWANALNRAYAKAGWNIRVDHRSFEDRGIMKVPTIHLGPKATAMERAGKYSDRGDINRIIEFGNAERRKLGADKQRHDAEIIDLQKVVADQLAQQQPGKDEGAKTYSKRPGDENSAAKDPPPMPDDPRRPDERAEQKPAAANQNPKGILPMAVGVDVPLSFAPETIAASNPAEIERLVAAIPEEQRIIFTAQTPEAEAPRREAWQQPAFNYDTIKADPWTAVYLAAPENASPALLNAAYNAAARCLEFLDHGGSDYADAVTHGPPEGNAADNRAKAEMRRDELHAMLFPIGAPAAEAADRERIAALEAAAHEAGREMLEAAPQPHRPETAAEAVQAAEAATAPAAPETSTSPTDGPQRAGQGENSTRTNWRSPDAPWITVDADYAADEITGRNRDPDELGEFVPDADDPPPVTGMLYAAADRFWEFEEAVLKAVDRGVRTTGNLLASAAALVEGFWDYLSDFVAPEPPMTREQIETAKKVHEERAEDAAAIDAYRQYLAEYDDRHTADRQAEQTRDHNRELGYDHDRGQSHELE
jgi:hypothetical protein